MTNLGLTACSGGPCLSSSQWYGRARESAPFWKGPGHVILGHRKVHREKWKSNEAKHFSTSHRGKEL